MGKLIVVIMLVFILPSICSAKQWDTTDKYLLAGLIAVQSLDCLQTNYIFEHKEEFHETNRLITKKSFVLLYFAAFTLIESLIAHKLDSKYRKVWLAGCILNSSSFVINNMILGIGFSF